MKELLEKLAKGETTVDDVLKAIDEADKEKVPRSRLNDKIDEIKDLTTQLQDRDKQLSDLGKKAKDHDDLAQQIKDLQKANDDATKEYQDKLAKQQFDFTLDKALAEAKAKNPKAVKALLNKETIKLDGEQLIGLSEQLKTLQESDGYLFGEEPPGLKGRQAHPPGQHQQTGMTKDQFKQLGYSDRIKIYNENPELYKQLSE